MNFDQRGPSVARSLVRSVDAEHVLRLPFPDHCALIPRQTLFVIFERGGSG